MKLAVSNIAWDAPEQGAVFDILTTREVDGIEVAPTKLWPDWRGAGAGVAEGLRRDFADRGFEVPALQAILYGLPDLKVFGQPEQRQALLEHLRWVAAIARGLGAHALVFGSPKNRDRGNLTPEQAFGQAVDFFRQAGEVCAAADVCLCIEPNPEGYACNFITRWREAEALVRAVAHPGVGLHLDTGCIHMAGDDPVEAIEQAIDITVHFHVSEPRLADLSVPVVDHKRVGKALRKSGYGGWVSIEMRRSDGPLASVAGAVDLVRECYLR